MAFSEQIYMKDDSFKFTQKLPIHCTLTLTSVLKHQFSKFALNKVLQITGAKILMDQGSGQYIQLQDQLPIHVYGLLYKLQ